MAETSSEIASGRRPAGRPWRVAAGLLCWAAAGLVALAAALALRHAAAHDLFRLGLPRLALFELRRLLLGLGGLLLPTLVAAALASWLAFGAARNRSLAQRRAALLLVLLAAAHYALVHRGPGPEPPLDAVSLGLVGALAAAALIFALLPEASGARAARRLSAALGRRRWCFWTGGPAAATLLVLLAGVPLYRERFAAGRPNLLLLVVDTLRADHLGPWAADAGTPHLDRFAARSAVFERAYAQGSNTINSAPCILASVYASEHGYFNYRLAVSRRLATAAEILADAGYETYAVSTNPHVSARNGLAQGFETFDEDGAWRDTEAEEVNRRFLAWLSSRSGRRPYFALLWYIDPHVPYAPPSDLIAEMVPADLAPLVGERTRNPKRPKGGPLTAEEREVSRRLYRGEVRSFDRELGRLVAALGRRGLLDDSLIVFTSDHGESLWERAGPDGEPLIGHGVSLYREEVAVPLIVRFPGGGPAGRVAPRAHSVDVLPTLLDTAGIEPGAALRRQIRGIGLGRLAERGPGRERPSFSELVTDEGGPFVMRRVSADHGALVRTRRYRERQFEPPLEECLDPAQGDAPVACSALPEGEDGAAALGRTLDRWREGLEFLAARPAALSDETEERVEERLRALGYLQ